MIKNKLFIFILQSTDLIVNNEHSFHRLSLNATAWVGWEPDEGWPGKHKREEQEEQHEREY